MSLGIPTFTLTLDSDDVSVYPLDLSRHVEFRTNIQPLEVISESQAWSMTMSQIEFTYTSASEEPVYVNVSMVDGTRIGSARTNLLYRIPGPVFAGVAANTRVVHLPSEHPALWTSVEADTRYRRTVEVALTGSAGEVLPTPAIAGPTVITLSFQRVA
jgi:hypothetical protein